MHLRGRGYETRSSLFSRASASLLPVIVPLTGRLEAEEIAIYEPYQRGFHAASERTSIGTISGDWVRKRSNGFDSRPDILLDLEYAHDDPAPEAVVEVTWVGREVVGISGGTTWTSTPLVGNGDTIGTTIRSSVLTPVDGWVKLPITFAAGAAKPARYDVWLRTADGGSLGPVDDDEDDDLRARVPPTPIPVPVPSPTPTGIPNDFFAVFDPHRWQQIEDRLGQLVRSTLTAFDGVLSDVDILRDRAVMRNVSATLRVRR